MASKIIKVCAGIVFLGIFLEVILVTLKLTSDLTLIYLPLTICVAFFLMVVVIVYCIGVAIAEHIAQTDSGEVESFL